MEVNNELGAQTEQPVPCIQEEKEYRRPKSELLREYTIEIEFLSIGCIVRVGCKKIAFSTIKEAMIAINEYIDNPVKMIPIWEKAFRQEEK